ncbi:MAG: CHASE2 domain-containing protein [Pseudanabaenaceae cyanobacterium SKYGB_i_bin29]|nr:CHASE2 domain-containing protein [Pseudanabaenaceae cyanobacterium SKYG29]MDW8422055.1 CHASE2 domain-containing protein [Pseudanabaenaceae cyanobacterium SKYGB_i_bin29]
MGTITTICVNFVKGQRSNLLNSKWQILTFLVWLLVGLGLNKVFPLLELQIQALFFRWRPPQLPPPEIVIIAIDELSLAQTEKFPWQRSVYAFAIDRLMQAGAQVVALDLLFVSPSIYGAKDDQRFFTTLQRYQGRLVLASSFDIHTVLKDSDS